MRLSFGRLRPAFHTYIKPRLSVMPFARFNRGRPTAGVIQPRVTPRIYCNPVPRVTPFSFWPWRRNDKK